LLNRQTVKPLNRQTFGQTRIYPQAKPQPA
jgi:hypothetical protein